MPKPIVKVSYGIASCYDNAIEINRKLDDYPELKRKIIKHELSHSPGGYTLKDYKIDYKSEKPYFYQSLKLAIKNPEMLIGFFFIMYSYYFQIFTYNLGSLFIFSTWGLIFSLLSTLIFKVNFLMAFLMWICIYSILNVILLIYTHIFVRKQQKLGILV